MERRTALITGGNAGIGKEAARQLAVMGRYGRIYLACRHRAKLGAARVDLQGATGKTILEILRLDVFDPASAASALAALQEPIDDLVMNAGAPVKKPPRGRPNRGDGHLRLQRPGPRGTG